MIGNDRMIFSKDSPVAKRQIEYAKNFSEVHIVVLCSRGFQEISLGDNVWIYPTNSISKMFYVNDAINLAKFIAKRRNVSMITTQDPWFTALIGLSVKKSMNVKLEIQVHGDIGSKYFNRSLKNKFLKLLALSNLPKADHIRVVSSKIKSYLVDSLNIEENKIEVRPIQIDKTRIENIIVEPQNDLHKKYTQFDKVILMASRLEPEKNVQLALESMKYVAKEHSSYGMIIVGSGSCVEKLKAFVQRNNLRNNVIFESWAEFEKLIMYYKTCDLFLSTSDYEGYGMTFVEAKTVGVKIISTDVGVAREVGATIVDRDPKEISKSIISLMEERN